MKEHKTNKVVNFCFPCIYALFILLIMPSCAKDEIGNNPLNAPNPIPTVIESPTITYNIEISEFEISEFKNQIKKCNKAIIEVSILLSNMGRYEHKYWESMNSIGGTVNYEDMAADALEWLYNKAEIDADVFNDYYTDICDQYKAIISMNITGNEAEEIEETISELFKSFNALYLLVTSPSGNITDFAKKFNEYSDNIVNNNSLLKVLVSNDDADNED